MQLDAEFTLIFGLLASVLGIIGIYQAYTRCYLNRRKEKVAAVLPIYEEITRPPPSYEASERQSQSALMFYTRRISPTHVSGLQKSGPVMEEIWCTMTSTGEKAKPWKPA